MKFSSSTITGLTVLFSLLSVGSSSSSSSAFSPNAPLQASIALSAPGIPNTESDTSASNDGVSAGTPDYKLLWSRINDISTVAFDHGVDLFGNTPSNNKKVDYDYWKLPTRRFDENNIRVECTNADRFIGALQLLCPTYVQYSRAMATSGKLAPNVVPTAISQTLARQFNEHEGEFNLDTAKSILFSELTGNSNSEYTDVQVAILMDTLTPLPHASSYTTARGQMYTGFLPNVGTVTVKIQNPNRKQAFEKDAKLLKNMAQFVKTFSEMLPEKKHATSVNRMHQRVQDLTATMERELDYQREIESDGGEILKEYCTSYVIVSRQIQMEDIAEAKSEKVVEPTSEIAVENSKELEMVTQGGGGLRKIFARLWRMDMKKVFMTVFALVFRIVTLGQLELYMDEA